MLLKKEYWIYGVFMGALFILLRLFEYNMFLRELSLERYAIVVAVIFLVLGIWAGKHIFASKKGEKNEEALQHTDSDQFGLSSREKEVLAMLALGLSNQEIADKLFVSLNTVKTHLSNIYMKLDVKRRTQAVKKGKELQIIA